MVAKTTDGKLSFSIEATIRAPPSRTFEALTDNEHLSRWFCTKAELDAKRGGFFQFYFDREGVVDEGEVVALQKNRLVKLKVGTDDGRLPSPEVTVTWKLAKSGTGTKVTLEQECPAVDMDSCKVAKDAIVPWGFYVHNLKNYLEKGIDERGSFWHKNAPRL